MMENNKHVQTEAEFLENYDISNFDRPSVTVDILLLTILDEKTSNYRKLPEKKLKVLLIKRNEHPYIEKWALPGGFVLMNESLKETAYRELKEETNVSSAYLEQLYTYGDVNRDPRGRIISTSFMSLIKSEDLKLMAGTDTNDVKWFSVESKVLKNEFINNIQSKTIEMTLYNKDVILKSKIKVTYKLVGKHLEEIVEVIKNDDLAFDHIKIIQYGLERLKNKAEYSGIVFNLMDETFTLSELQKSYEVILDRKLLKSNFRRKVSKMVTETNKETIDKSGHRPAKLFAYNPMWIYGK